MELQESARTPPPGQELGLQTHTAIPGFLHGVWGATQALLQQTRYLKKS